MSYTTTLQISRTGRAVVAARGREGKQKDELCGAFCGAVAVSALMELTITQEAVAQAAGTRLSAEADPDGLPPGESPRRDYLLELPRAHADETAGTSANGVALAVKAVSSGTLAAVPLVGDWSRSNVEFLFDLAAEPETAVVLNVATRHMWSSHVDLLTVHDYLAGVPVDAPSSEWNVGHFILLVGSITGAHRRLGLCADTYPTIGNSGLHLQTLEGIAAALNRTDDPNTSGGALIIVPAANTGEVRRRAKDAKLAVAFWDNGSPEPGLG